MGLRINDTIPNLHLETDLGSFDLHDWIGAQLPNSLMSGLRAELRSLACLLTAQRSTLSGSATSRSILARPQAFRLSLTNR